MSTALKKEKGINPMLLVKKSYLAGFFGSIVVVILGLFVAQIINRYLSLDETMIRIFQAFSLVPDRPLSSKCLAGTLKLGMEESRPNI